MFTSDEDYSEMTFEALDQKGLRIEGSVFEGCTFKGCTFSGGIFRRCRFLDCTFENSDLSNGDFTGASLREVTFRSCKMLGVNWSSASALDHLHFEGSMLSYGVFASLDLKRWSFKDSLARDVDFSEADLSGADLRGADLAGARFSGSNLTGADLRGAKSYTIRASDTKLKNAKFSLPEATLLLYGLGIELEE